MKGLKTLAALALMLSAAVSLRAEIRLPAFFADNMVLQQQTQANLWGWASPSKTVTVKTGWDGKTYTTTAAADGKWKLAVETPVAGGPYDLTISDGQPLTLKNVLIGEVWVCSGQSNMEMPMKGFKMQPVEGANMDAAYSKNPRIRLFTVGLNSQTTPQDTVKADGLQGKNSTVYDMVEQAPEFPGGPQAMMQFIKDNLQYPQIAKENGIQGRVILQFVVDETGQVTDPKVIRSIDPSLDTEAIRLVLSMPRWMPGMQDGKAVAVRYTIPVIFKLETAEETSSKDGVLSIKAGNMSEVSGEISKLLMNSDSLVILVDGVPATEETLHALSADKIATMSILKDKLDGMAAAKGKKTVIAIATDSGKPSIVVSGAVVDEKGGPILGALVRVVGSVKKGVVTDGQGNFTITVPEGCSLEVSYIDHQTTVVKAQPKLEVTLKAE